MASRAFLVEGELELFEEVVSPWHYVRVPEEYTEVTRHLAVRGLVPITVTLGRTTWDTSLLPLGDGTHFIAVNAKVRKAERIALGDRIKLTFRVRVPGGRTGAW